MQLIFTAGLKNLASNIFRTILTILGIAIGVNTVATILMLDYNTRLSESKRIAHLKKNEVVPLTSDIQIIPLEKFSNTPRATAKPPENILEEDYEIMRSAVRLASLLSFFISTIIIYYTIGFSIQQRKKELALLTSLGATFQQIAMIVLFEALVMGTIGSVLGLVGAWPLFKILKILNVTTTGRGYLNTEAIPSLEFAGVLLIGILTAILGAVQPTLKLRNFSVSTVLQPRFLSEEKELVHSKSSNIFSFIIPMLSLTYILMRPFMKQFIPSIFFYVGELGFIVGIFLMVVFFVPQIISYITQFLGRFWLKLFPLEGKLSYSRFTHFSQLISWPISNIMLVFAFLLTLHTVTKSLKQETLAWGENAARGLAFINTYNNSWTIPDTTLMKIEDNYTYVRLSMATLIPNKIVIIDKAELKKYQQRAPEFSSIIDDFDEKSIILSNIMAQELGVQIDDLIVFKFSNGSKKFKVIAITDKLGFFPYGQSYRDQRSYALIDQHNAHLLNLKDMPMNNCIVIWSKNDPFHNYFTSKERASLRKVLDKRVDTGLGRIHSQISQFTKDFFIFDVILLLATMLAALGVTNTMLIQLQARNREIALLQVLGMSSSQILRMILIEAFFIGKIGAFLAMLLAIPLGWASVEALSVVSVFKTSVTYSIRHFTLVFAGAIFVTIISALYPAFIGFKLKTSESIHYE